MNDKGQKEASVQAPTWVVYGVFLLTIRWPPSRVCYRILIVARDRTVNRWLRKSGRDRTPIFGERDPATIEFLSQANAAMHPEGS